MNWAGSGSSEPARPTPVRLSLKRESRAEIDLQEVVLGSVDDIPGGFREHPDMRSKAILESSTITTKANAVFMIVLLIDTKDNYPQLIRVALGSIFQMLSLLLSLVRSY